MVLVRKKKECIDILREHIHEMSISKEEINARLEEAWDRGVAKN